MSFLDLVLSIPGYVESCIKTYKAIQAYRELDESFKNLMNRAIRDSERLKHTIANLKKLSEYSEASQSHFRYLIQQAKGSMDNINTILENWKNNLRITDSDDPPPPKTKRIRPSLLAFLCRSTANAGKTILFRLGVSFGKLPIQDERQVASAEAETKKGKSDDSPSQLVVRFAELRYLIEGKPKIAEALEDLERILEQLDSALIASNSISAESKSDTAAVGFVSHAKERCEKNLDVAQIDIESLEPLSDIDSEMPTGIYRVETGRYEGCIVDPRNVRYYTAKGKEKRALFETENIARLFAEEPKNSHISSSVGILPSCGRTELEPHLHGIVFRLPPGLDRTRTLRNMLVEGDVKHSLHERVQFAIRLATSILVVHSLGLVHKNVKPDSILVAESPVGKPQNLYPYKLGVPFLLAFDASRTSSGPSMQGSFAVPEGGLWEILYTHPRHLIGYERQFDYEMRDDIFGLGICLLEVALWKSIFRWAPKATGIGGHSFQVNTDVVDVSLAGCKQALIDRGLPADTGHIMVRKDILEEAAEKLIPPIMGNIFKDVVVECLTFGDVKGTNGVSAVRSGPDDEEQSVLFVQSVLTKLYSIKV